MMDTSVKKAFLSYLLGFGLSVLLTLVAYLIVVEHLLPASILIPAALVCGFVQALIQLLLFLHLGKEPKPRWNFHVFLFMLTVAIIIIGGSLWIMNNLVYNDMSRSAKNYD